MYRDGKALYLNCVVNLQNIRSFKKLSKWFMYAAVLCSLLTFSGFVSQSRIDCQGKAQTELRVSIQNNSGNTTLYRSLSIVSNVELTFPGCGAINTNGYLVLYERIMKTRFLKNLKYWSSYKKPGKLIRTPYTRRKYPELFSNTLRG